MLQTLPPYAEVLVNMGENVGFVDLKSLIETITNVNL